MYYLRRYTALFALALGIFICVAPAMAARYVTWEGFEADKLASIWLIKRHIDHDATFVFLAPGTKPTSDIPFDTPYGALARRPNRASFEVILSHYRLTDPGIVKIARYIHDLEINIWENKKYPQSRDIRRFVAILLSGKKTPQDIIDETLPFFDQLYKKSLPPDDQGRINVENKPELP